jgi:integrase
MGSSMSTSRRRASGEGSIYLRSDGRWAGVVTLALGKRKFVYGKTQGEAIEKKKRIEDARDNGLLDGADRILNICADEWLAYKRVNVSTRTYERYEQLIRIHVRPTLGRRKLQQMVPTDFTTLYSELLIKGLSANTVRHVHVAARTMIQDALRWGYVSRNVVSLARPPKVVRVAMSILDRPEVDRLMIEADGTPLRALWRVALGTALRAGEMAALRWSDIDLGTNELTVNHSLRDLKGGAWSLGAPKSVRSRRKIGLTKSLADELKAHRARQNERIVGSGEQYSDNGFVFAREDGRPLIVSSLKRRHLEPILRAAGLPVSTRVHDLRHTAISHALAQGAPIADVSQWAGHASVAITLSLYAHALPEANKRTTETVALALGI